jgi:hypothetical protein
MKPTAHVHTREVEVISVKEIKTVSLELSMEDASVLTKVLHNVGGNPSGLRSVIDRITESLATAGIEPMKTKTEGSIYFR